MMGHWPLAVNGTNETNGANRALMQVKPCVYVLLDTCGDVVFISCWLELFAYDVFIEFDVSVGYALCIFVCYFRHHLSWLVHEIVVDEPLAYEFL